MAIFWVESGRSLTSRLEPEYSASQHIEQTMPAGAIRPKGVLLGF